MKLSLEAFRGVNAPFIVNFDTKQNLTVLYGENGSGKTTISDAFEFVVHGTAGSLEEKSLDGKSRLGQLVNARRKKVDLSVSLIVQNKTRSAKLSGSKTQHVGELEQQLKVLSRKNITKLIEEAPTQRFKRIQDFVSIPALDREEAALNDLVLTEKRNLETQSKLIAQANEILKELFTEHADKDKYGDRQSVWQRDILSESKETITEHLSILQNLNQEIKRLRIDFKPLEESYPALKKASENDKAEAEALAKLITDHSDDLAKAFETIQQAQGYLNQSDVDTCPVCDTNLGHQALVQKVNQKLEILGAVKDQSFKAKKARNTLQNTKTFHSTLQQSFFSIIDRLKQAHQTAIDSEQCKLPALVPSILSAKKTEELTEESFTILKAEASKLKPLSDTVEKEHTALQNRLKLQTEIRQAIKRIKVASSANGT